MNPNNFTDIESLPGAYRARMGMCYSRPMPADPPRENLRDDVAGSKGGLVLLGRWTASPTLVRRGGIITHLRGGLQFSDRQRIRPGGFSLKDQWDPFVEDVPPTEPAVLSRPHFEEWDSCISIPIAKAAPGNRRVSKRLVVHGRISPLRRSEIWRTILLTCLFAKDRAPCGLPKHV
jgi:hypothetical protein